MTGPAHRSSCLLPARPALAGCLFAAILRDTRGVDLPEQDRFNFFPASPLCSFSLFLEGRSHLVSETGVTQAHALPKAFVSGPQRRPISSWNPGAVNALTIGFYPDAWPLMFNGAVGDCVDRTIALQMRAKPWFGDLCGRALRLDSAEAAFEALQDGIERERRDAPAHASRRLSDWARRIALHAATSKAGVGMRQMQRRIKTWTGLNQREIEVFARVEHLFALRRDGEVRGDGDMAQIAAAAGFADQSHMGRAVRRVTGYPPARLAARIAQEEAFWCYRLLGETM